MTVEPITIGLRDLTTNEDSKELSSVLVNAYFTIPAGHTAAVFQPVLEQAYRFLKLQGWQFPEPYIDMDFPVFRVIPSHGEFRYFFTELQEPVQYLEDTVLLQIGVSSILPPADGWTAARKLLADILDSCQKLLFKLPGVQWLGNSIIYKSNYNKPLTAAVTIQQDITALLQPLQGTANATLNLVREEEDGLACMVKILNRTGMEPSIIYLVLGRYGQADQLLYRDFYAPGALYTVADRFVYKSTYQWLQLKDQTFDEFEALLTRLGDRTRQVLDDFSGKGKVPANALRTIALDLSAIMSRYQLYKRLQLSLEKQHKNMQFQYDNSRSWQQENRIFQYLAHRLSQQVDDGRLTMERAAIIIEQTNMVIGLVEAQESKVANDRSDRNNFLIAFVALLLTFVQLFDNEAATGLLQTLQLLPQELTPDDVHWLTRLLTKVVAAGLVMGLGVLFLRAVQQWLPAKKY
ncbi:MAG: hypothetical protein P0Y53_18995 [Candidatus Pseudobacter hemicellulosilyticus]|uniref:Uncharacterized protein n=1 Tax=Candidatus Pseudobacter hemicellulosilyticus TaxID=3121375 RepID=A0AAJ6BGA7_9BACT|nr:MAG: hypothetical protein P0Y53_18995 [Pseudobacter sp.]